ncbi:hypothetical protein OAE88_00675 [bacterium]|nr:hypothetical protein [bacterium]
MALLTSTADNASAVETASKIQGEITLVTSTLTEITTLDDLGATAGVGLDSIYILNEDNVNDYSTAILGDLTDNGTTWTFTYTTPLAAGKAATAASDETKWIDASLVVSDKPLEITVAGSDGGDGALNTSTTSTLPSMTGNNIPNTHLVFDNNSNRDPWYGADGDTATAWFSDYSPTYPVYWGCVYDTPIAINKFSLYFLDADGSNHDSPASFDFEYSDNTTTGMDGTWVSVGSFTISASGLQEEWKTFTNSTTRKGWRVKMNSKNGLNTYINIMEFNFVEADAGSTSTSLKSTDLITTGDSVLVYNATDLMIAAQDVGTVTTTDGADTSAAYDSGATGGNMALTGSNLIATKTATGFAGAMAYSTLYLSSYEVVAEFTVNTVATTNAVQIGISATNTKQTNPPSGEADAYIFNSDGDVYNAGVINSSYGDSVDWTNLDVIKVRYSWVTGELEYYRNGVSQGIAVTLTPNTPMYLVFAGYYINCTATVAISHEIPTLYSAPITGLTVGVPPTKAFHNAHAKYALAIEDTDARCISKSTVPLTVLQTADGSTNPSVTDATPIMTTGTAPNGTVTSDTEFSASYEDWMAFDASVTGGYGWQTASDAGGGHGQLTFTFDNGLTATAINKYSITGSVTSNRSPATWVLYGSLDGTFTDQVALDTVSDLVVWGVDETRTYSFDNDTSYLAYRLDVTTVGSAGLILAIQDFKLIEATTMTATDGSNIVSSNVLTTGERLVIDGVDAIGGTVTTSGDSDGANNASTTDSVPTLTTYAGANGIAFSSNERSTTEIWKAFTAAGYWGHDINEVDPKGGYLFDTGIIINKITYQCSADLAYVPETFRIEGSLDSTTGLDGTWVTLSTPAGLSWTASEIKTFTFDNNIRYKGYRLVLTDLGSSGYTDVTELQFIENTNPAAYSMAITASHSLGSAPTSAYRKGSETLTVATAPIVVDGTSTSTSLKSLTEIITGDSVFVYNATDGAIAVQDVGTVTEDIIGADALLDTVVVGSNMTLSGSNLVVTKATTTHTGSSAYSDTIIDSGVVYFEATITVLGGTSNMNIGFAPTQSTSVGFAQVGSGGLGYHGSGFITGDLGDDTAPGTTFAVGEVLGASYTHSTGVVRIYKDGTLIATSTVNFTPGTDVYPAVASYDGSGQWTVNFNSVVHLPAGATEIAGAATLYSAPITGLTEGVPPTEATFDTGTNRLQVVGTNATANMIKTGDTIQIDGATEVVPSNIVESVVASIDTTGDMTVGTATALATYTLDDGTAGLLSNAGVTGGDNGTATDVTYGTGQFNNCAIFNGTTSKITASTTLSSANGARSISCWLKHTETAQKDIIGYGSYASNEMFMIRINAGGAGNIGIGGYANDHTYTATVNDGAWHHIVATHDGTTLTMYVDKVSVGSTATTFATSTTNSFLIGVDIPSGTYLNGSVDQLRTYNSALTQAEVESLFNESIPAYSKYTATIPVQGSAPTSAVVQDRAVPLTTTHTYNATDNDFDVTMATPLVQSGRAMKLRIEQEKAGSSVQIDNAQTNLNKE